MHHWGGPNWIPGITDQGAPPTWTYLGRQGANATGRANARAKVMMRFRDASSTEFGQFTLSLSRTRRDVAMPLEGTSCEVAGTFVGTSSTVYESTAADWKFNNRLLPVFDFGLEFAPPGVTVGYKEVVVLSASSGTGQRTGCYKILWD